MKVKLVLRDPETKKVETQQVETGGLKELAGRLIEISTSKTIIIGEVKKPAAREKG